MNNKSALVILAALAFSSCQVREPEDRNTTARTFEATIEDNSLKTSLDEHGNVLWNAGDQISIFAGSTINEQYQVNDISEGKTSAELNRVSTPGFVAGGEIGNNVAIYPYSKDAGIALVGNSYVIEGIVLPSVQIYAPDSFGRGAFPMAAVTSNADDLRLKFKNILGGIKIQLTGSASITSISIQGNNGEVLCGNGSITADTDTVPTITLLDDSATTITLTCGDGVQLSEDISTSFVLAMPPMTMAAGFTVVATDTEGKRMVIESVKEQTIVRSTILKMPAIRYEGAGADPYMPSDALPGLFSIGENRMVYFSKGNLQFTCGADQPWGFAEKQYEIVGDTKYNQAPDIYNISKEKTDLFGWSGDSHKHYGKCTQTASSYFDGYFLEWGDNFGTDNTWRTLSEGEWSYLLGNSEERNNKYRNWVTVQGIKGLVIAPDNYTDSIEESYDDDSWDKAEKDGLVFLPISGYRYGNDLIYTDRYGYYWTSTSSSRYSQYASYVFINENNFGVTGSNSQPRRYACCVRLVSDYNSHTTDEGHEYIDLGLPSGTLWATTNIGAATPESGGDYFAWGATTPYYSEGGAQSEDASWKEGYSEGYCFTNAPYQTSNTTNEAQTRWMKYLGGIDSEYKDESATDIDAQKIILCPEDDAATVNWGSNWRIPTASEWEELIDSRYCFWRWESVNGMNGFRIKSTNSAYTKSLFIPCSALRYDLSLSMNYNSSGDYQSSTVYIDNPSRYLICGFNSTNKDIYNSLRADGLPIRPVYSNDSTSGITGVEMKLKNVSIAVGNTLDLEAEVKTRTGAVNTIVYWSSSDRSVAKVDNSGRVTAISTGTAVITATSAFGGFSDSCEIDIKQYIPDGIVNGYEYIDLGLSVKWATMNVGATSIEDSGKYYAWGGIVPNQYFHHWDQTPFCHYDYSSYEPYWYKYLGSTSSQYKDPSAKDSDAIKDVLDLEDDAAHANMGGDWRMPTKSEWYELVNYCKWTWESINGINGYKVEKNNKWIFLPASGYNSGSSPSSVNSYGYYWSSELGSYDPKYASCLQFYSRGKDTYNNAFRYYGCSVRGIVE